jgi:hypothetical protein
VAIVSRTGTVGVANSTARSQGKGGLINDDLGVDGTTDLLRRAFALILTATYPGAGWYVCAPNGPASLAFSLALAEIDVWHSSLVWVKNSLVLGRGDYHYRHEQIFYGWTPGAPGAGTRPSGRASCASRNNVVGAKPGAFGAGRHRPRNGLF